MDNILKDAADVTVTFTDGKVKNYRITAGVSIGGYLAREAMATGVLSLFNKTHSWAIPVTNIRDWALSPVAAETQQEAEQ